MNFCIDHRTSFRESAVARFRHCEGPGEPLHNLAGAVDACRHELRMAVIVFLALALGNCTVVETIQDGNVTSRAIGVGLAEFPDCRTEGQLVRVMNLGGTVARNEIQVGFNTSETICLPVTSCAAIFYVRSDQQVAAIRRHFASLSTDCIIKE